MRFYQHMPHPETLGMGYIFRTDSGKLLVIDGGLDAYSHDTEGSLFDALCRLSGSPRPHIDEWIFTHIHSDHVGEFCRMAEDHNGEFTVGRFHFNFPSEAFLARHAVAKDLSWFRRFRKAYCLYHQDPTAYDRYRRVLRGDRFTLDGIEVEFLRVPNENILPNPVNNTSIVFRLKAAGQRWLFLGDLGVEGGNELAAICGEGLSCDICQMAHHGQKGVGDNVYALAAPKICIFSSATWCWNNTEPARILHTRSLPEIRAAKHIVACLTGNAEWELPLNCAEERR
ncbi:MAG: hypothetical protein IKL89_04940 [Clostridia bacterium]|nr:hypothetical protein [Clostridia bacterium]